MPVMPKPQLMPVLLTACMVLTSPALLAEETQADSERSQRQKSQWDVRTMDAKQLWVTDKLETPLRSCPAERCRVVKVVRPGMEITQIGYTPDGWALIVSGKTKGYLPKRYLQDTPIASQQLAGAQQQSLEALQAKQALEAEMETLKSRAEASESELGTLRKENYELKQELEYVKGVSSQTLMVNEDNRRLKNEIEALRQKNAILEQEAADVEGKNQRAWFMVGAGVLFIGWLVGRFARLPRRRGWNEI